MTRAALPLLCALILVPAALTVAPAPPRAADFVASRLDGSAWKSADCTDKVLVVVFLSTECPMANSYLSALGDLAKTYAGKGVTVVGVNANKEESAADVKAHAKEFRVGFEMLRDPDHKAVAALDAKVTPEAFVLDAARVVRYRGRIDDGYSARLKPRGRIDRRDLADAVAAVLAGKDVKEARTTAYGCPIPGVERRVAAKGDRKVTFHKDVEPILQKSCQSCHRPGQVGPFSLMTYGQAVKWSDDLVGETKAGRMPPWKPSQRGVFTNERHVSPEALKTLEAWVAQGCPEGDPKDAPPEVVFRDGWKLGTPDLILEMSEDAVVGPTGRDLFRVVVFPTNLPEDKYIAAVEVQPGNPRVVHHTVNMIDTKGRGRKLAEAAAAKKSPDDKDRGPGYVTRMGFGFLPDPANGLGGWAPGLVPQPLPPGVGQKLPKGADLLMQVHYHRTGKEERDRTKIGIYFQKGAITTAFQAMPVPGLFFRIPAGAADFAVESRVRLTDDVTLHYFVPHMHLLGKKIALSAQVPGGKEETLIDIDSWDYNWQEMYQLKTPKKLPTGTILRVKATFDNSSGNPLNPSSPPKAVRFGEQTHDEMCFVFCGVSSAKGGFKFVPLLGK